MQFVSQQSIEEIHEEKNYPFLILDRIFRSATLGTRKWPPDGGRKIDCSGVYLEGICGVPVEKKGNNVSGRHVGIEVDSFQSNA
jgi:hypothetical protein